MKDVTIVGVGRVGGALAISLSRAGYNVVQLIGRSTSIARSIKLKFRLSAAVEQLETVRQINSSLIIICTDDAEIEAVSERLFPYLRRSQNVLHTSGSLTSEVLGKLAGLGCETGSMHPLVSISDPINGAGRFAGSYFCVEGTRKAAFTARKIVRDIGAKAFTIPTDKKALYHASAVTVAGHVVALFDSGVEMLGACGVSRREAERVLLPLTKSTLENLSKQSPAKALTGTFARLDVDGLARHIAAFNYIPADLREVYFVLAERSLSLMESNGVKDPRIKQMRRMIFVAKGKRR